MTRDAFISRHTSPSGLYTHSSTSWTYPMPWFLYPFSLLSMIILPLSIFIYCISLPTRTQNPWGRNLLCLLTAISLKVLGTSHTIYLLVRWRYVQVFALVLSLSSPFPPLDFRLSTCKKIVWVLSNYRIQCSEIFMAKFKISEPKSQDKMVRTEEIDNWTPVLFCP